MPRGYRCIVLAVLGWLVLAAAPTPDNTGQLQRPQATAKAERGHDKIASTQDGPTKPTEAGEYQRPCPEGEYNNKSDLCVQWYAARAAQESADWAFWALWVGGISALGLIITLIFNYLAWKQGREGRQDTQRAIREARRSNIISIVSEKRARREAVAADEHTQAALRIAQDNAKSAADQVTQFRESQRAWVRLDLVPHKIAMGHNGGLHFNLDVVAENVGQTVATHFELNAAIFFKGQEETSERLFERIERQVDIWELEHSTEAIAALMPKDKNLEIIRTDIPGEEVSWWTGFGHGAGRVQALVLGAVYYRTESKPDLLQVSWRSWYVSDGRGAKPVSFIDRNTAELLRDEIMVSPYSQSTVHEERLHNQQRSDN